MPRGAPRNASVQPGHALRGLPRPPVVFSSGDNPEFPIRLSISMFRLGLAVGFEPGQHLVDAAGGEAHAGVCTAVVEVDRVAVWADGVAAGEDDVVDVSEALVGLFGPED